MKQETGVNEHTQTRLNKGFFSKRRVNERSKRNSIFLGFSFTIFSRKKFDSRAGINSLPFFIGGSKSEIFKQNDHTSLNFSSQ